MNSIPKHSTHLSSSLPGNPVAHIDGELMEAKANRTGSSNTIPPLDQKNSNCITNDSAKLPISSNSDQNSRQFRALAQQRKGYHCFTDFRYALFPKDFFSFELNNRRVPLAAKGNPTTQLSPNQSMENLPVIKKTPPR